MFRLSFTVIACALLVACASPQKPKVREPNIPSVVTAPEKSDDTLNLAKIIADFQSGSSNALGAVDLETQNALLQLADNYLRDGACNPAKIIVKHALQLSLSPENIAKANIIRSECAVLADLESTALADASDLHKAELQLRLSSWLSNTSLSRLSLDWQARHTLLQAYLAALQKRYESAIDVLLSQDLSASVLALQTEAWLFSWLNKIPADSRLDIVERHPALFDYQSLLSIVEDTQLNDAQRQEQLRDNLARIQQTNPAFIIPPQISQYVSVKLQNTQRIAVLLPLSGRLEGQGQAIQQGVLAGYYAEYSESSASQTGSFAIDTRFEAPASDALEISFIDTGSEDSLPETINAQSLAQFTTIIGPLLKPQIAELHGIAPKDALMIHLNQVDEMDIGVLKPSSEQAVFEEAYTDELRHYFALSPEQEAEQLVDKMSAANILHPVLIYDNSNLSTRMADAFLNAWQKQHASKDALAPSKVSYSDNKSMKVGITSALDVLQSEQRINQLSALVNERVFSVTRNRRDVDAFVVFARPNELELINPIIESSMSLFTDEQIPVFATSFSYNHKQNRNSLRDLRNLVFVDMPFVLPEGRNTKIAEDVDTLFNQPSSTFLRLFAFGHDTLRLTQDALKLRMFNDTSAKGLSGELRINTEGLVLRELDTLAITTGE